MNHLVDQWALDSQFLVLFAIVSTQIALLVLCAGTLTRFNNVSGACKHRIWVGVTLLILGLLPSYLLAPSWLRAGISIPIDFEVVQPVLIDPGPVAIIDSATRTMETELGPVTSPTVAQRLHNANTIIDLRSETTLASQLDEHQANPNGEELVERNAPTHRLVQSDRGPQSRIEAVGSGGAALSKPAADVKSWVHFSKYGFMLSAVLYIVVCSFLLSRLWVGWWRLNRMCRSGIPLAASSLEIAQQATAALRLKFVPRLVRSLNVPTPMTWGILYPTVVLPDSFETWSLECRKAVLMHELSHIARRDAFFDLIARFCSVVYWFHPAVHFLARALVNSREEATDARVIASGFSPSLYAKQLLEVAERCLLVRNRDCFPAVPMATRSSIEMRVLRILRSTDVHADWPSWRTALFGMSVASLLLLSIPFRLLPSVATTLVAQKMTAGATTLFERVQSMEIAEAPENAVAWTFEGVVRKSDFTAARAVIFCLSVENSTAILVGKTVTDAHGRYLLSIAATESQREHLKLYAVDSLSHFDGASRRSIANAKSNQSNHISFVLSENTGRVEGELVGPGGRPMIGIKVKVRALYAPTVALNVRDVENAPFEFNSVSDESGHFVIDGLPSNMQATVTIDSDDWDCLDTMVGTSSDTPAVERRWARTMQYFAGSGKIQLLPKSEITGLVVDSQSSPVVGARIRDAAETITTTDINGRFTIRRVDPNVWGVIETVVVEPPSDSRFSKKYVTFDREQLSTRTIEPVVLEGTWVSGRILSTKSKKPLAGIQIQAENYERDLPVTDVDGKFRIALAPGERTLRFVPQWMNSTEKKQFQDDSKSRAVRQIDLLDNEPADLGTILLNIDTAAAKPVTIRVVSSDGEPVADCQVVLRQTRGLASLVQGNSIGQQILTDTQGFAVVKPAVGWSTTGLSRTMARGPLAANLVTVFYPSKSPRFFANLERPEEIPTDVVELKLSEGALYSGRVLLNGSPLVGIAVSLDDRNPSPYGIPNSPNSDQLQALTNERGEFAIYAPEENSYAIKSLRHFPYGNWSISTNLRPSSTDDPLEFVFGDIELACGTRRISGTVVSADGKPIRNAKVRCQRHTQVFVNQSIDHTDDEGRFFLSSLPEGVLTLEVQTSTNDRATFEIAEEQTEIDVVMAR
ncbi:MAG: carboxypeptidase regulatory-like domain-containing protein [Planctomycetales bacterium]|nr:carboxypeptidase regulatory-like domain-containing protein [Planctomycetales bacterium]